MKIVSLVSRLLLGLMFTVFGLNGFLHFLPMGPMPTGLAGQYIGALFQSHYLNAVAFFQLIPGVLLLFNRYVPLALALLAPVIANILFFHIFLNPAGIGLGLLAFVLWAITVLSVRSAFTGLLQQRV